MTLEPKISAKGGPSLPWKNYAMISWLKEGGGGLVWSLIVGQHISIYIVIKTFEPF